MTTVNEPIDYASLMAKQYDDIKSPAEMEDDDGDGDPPELTPTGDEDIDDDPTGDPPGEPVPTEPTPDPRDEVIDALRQELSESRRATQTMLERLAPPKDDAPQETDYDALIDEHFEPDSAAAQVFRKLTGKMREDFDRKLEARVSALQRGVDETQITQREKDVISSLVENGDVSNDQVDELRELAHKRAHAIRERGGSPDLESSYEAAALQLGRKHKHRAGDAEERKRAELAKRKKLATQPGNAAPDRTVSKLNDKDMEEAVKVATKGGDFGAALDMLWGKQKTVD